jgi:hypothetical protein
MNIVAREAIRRLAKTRWPRMASVAVGAVVIGCYLVAAGSSQSSAPNPNSENRSSNDDSINAVSDSSYAGKYKRIIPRIDLTSDTMRIASPRPPEREGTCFLYERHIVVAWESPEPWPVAIVRKRDPETGPEGCNCTPDSLPGDFVLRNEWAEYFYGMWGDLLFIDSGTGTIRSLIVYDVSSGSKVLELDGAGEMESWIDEQTVRIWMLAGSGLPRSLCPDIPLVLDVGIDSLYALDLSSFSLTALGPWRCHALQ